nr:D-alanyl-D-alanine carboxypeptidase family protein [Caproicibacter fermentans]
MLRQDIGKGSLILVNPSHPMRCEPSEKDLKSALPGYSEIFVERRMARMLRRLIDSLRASGQIVPVSGFRTMQEQKQIYADCERDNGAEFTRNFVAIPGCSEHQTGLAIDLAENRPEIDFIRPEFPHTGVCQKFREQCARFGLIERYRKGCEFITQIAPEPWHFRYVGCPHSEIINREGLTLEEYTDFLKCFPYDGTHLFYPTPTGKAEIFFVKADGNEPVSVRIPDETPYRISGNNEDGFVLTMWERKP